MSFEEAMSWAARDDRFKATVYVMNTLLISKGVYSQQEFENHFVEWVAKEKRRKDLEPRDLFPTAARRA